MPLVRIAVVGDFNPAIVAHRAVNASFALAARVQDNRIEPEWLGTEAIEPDDAAALERFDALWCVPGSPYRSPTGALWAIRFARTNLVPFLGTCGGYQHALLEFARNELKLPDAGHREEAPSTQTPVIDRLRCPLIEQKQEVTITERSFESIYGGTSGAEGYHCSYGLNSAYEKSFAGTSLRVVARSPEGEARAFQLKDHPFFVGTQFQPERRALEGSIHPILQAFFASASNRQKGLQ